MEESAWRFVARSEQRVSEVETGGKKAGWSSFLKEGKGGGAKGKRATAKGNNSPLICITLSMRSPLISEKRRGGNLNKRPPIHSD